MGARPGLDFIRRKWLHVIINDDFLEEGECYDRALLPSIICLGRLRIASKNIFNLWQLRQGVDSLAQWLEHWIFNWEDRVRFPRQAWDFFSYASFLCCGFHVVRLSIYLCKSSTVYGTQTESKIEWKAMIRNRYNYPTPPIRDIKWKETQTQNNWILIETSLAESQTDSYFPTKWPNGYPKQKDVSDTHTFKDEL